MTARFGICERLLISPSVRPSLRYSLLGSLLALTKGNTAIDEISCWLVRLRYRTKPSTANTRTSATAGPAIQRRLGFVGATTDPEAGTEGALELPAVLACAPPTIGVWAATGDACSVAAATALRFESVSRFSRCRSARISAACW